jgi:hypothetical protein
MIYARFNSTDYKLEQRPVLTFSASETTFSEIVIDFTGKTAADLPIKYQEIQIVDTSTNPDTVLYYGYCSEPRLPAFNGTIQRVLLTIELMSPQTYLTKRTVDILIKNDNIHDAVEDILAGIVSNDGFTIQSNDLPTTEYLSELISHRTVESVLSNLGGRFGFIWYVDELKRIFIKYLPNIETSAAVYSLTSPTATDLESVQPYFNVSDYANRVNFTNVNLVSGQDLLIAGTALTADTSYSFPYPFSISEYVVYRLPPATGFGDDTFALLLTLVSLEEYKITVDVVNQTITYDAGIGFSGVDDAVPGIKVLLETDSENTNLITGFKWVGATKEVDICLSYSALRPATMSYIDPVEIAANAGKLNTSGIVEKEVDVFGKYFTYEELTAYAKTFLRQNNKQADIVDLRFNGDDLSALKSLLVPTAKVYISLPSQFIPGGDYVVTSGEYVIDQGKSVLTVQCRKASLTENYVDIFRKEVGNADETQDQFITYYSQDENTVLAKKIIVDGEEVDV